MKISKTDLEEKLRYFTKNRPNKNKLEEFQKENSFILLKVNNEEDNNNQRPNPINLLKNIKSDNIIRIGKFINSDKKNNLSLPKNNQKLILPSQNKFINSKIKDFFKNVNERIYKKI